jgi:hypothetical protein
MEKNDEKPFVQYMLELKRLQSHRPQLYRDFHVGFGLLLKGECSQEEFSQLSSKLAAIFNKISLEIQALIPKLEGSSILPTCHKIQSLEHTQLKQTISLFSLKCEDKWGDLDRLNECADMQKNLDITVEDIIEQMSSVQETISLLL